MSSCLDSVSFCDSTDKPEKLFFKNVSQDGEDNTQHSGQMGGTENCTSALYPRGNETEI